MHADAPRTAVQNACALVSSVSLPVSGRFINVRGRLQPGFNHGSGGGGGGGDGFHVPASVLNAAPRPLTSKLISFEWVTVKRKDSFRTSFIKAKHVERLSASCDYVESLI